MKKSILAMPAAATAIPRKPKTPATRATTKNISAQRNIGPATTLGPDLVILDITMPVLKGLDAARVILDCRPKTPILILSVHRSKQLIEEAKRIGVRGYVTKGETIQNLIRAADAVLADQTFFLSDL